MSKNKFKLSLNKQVVSKLNEKKIVGGVGIIGAGISEDPTCPYSDWICFKSDRPGECPWSYHTNSNDSPR